MKNETSRRARLSLVHWQSSSAAVAETSNSAVQFIDPRYATKIGKRLLGDRANLKKLEFSPDGQTLLVLDESGLLKFWEVAHGLPLFTWRAPEPLRDFYLSPDGRWLALVYEERTELVEISPLHSAETALSQTP